MLEASLTGVTTWVKFAVLCVLVIERIWSRVSKSSCTKDGIVIETDPTKAV